MLFGNDAVIVQELLLALAIFSLIWGIFSREPTPSFLYLVLGSAMKTFQFKSHPYPALNMLETSLPCLIMCQLPLQVQVCCVSSNCLKITRKQLTVFAY